MNSACTAPVRGAAGGSFWVRRMLRGVGAGALLVAAAAGCGVLDDALDVETPDRIPAGNLESPSQISLLVTGAIGDFDCAFGSYTALGGLISDELLDATQTASRWEYDRRDVDPVQDVLYAQSSCEGLGVYTPLSTARWAAENALLKLDAFADGDLPAGTSRQALIGTAAAYSGYGHLLLGEGFCSGVLLEGPDLVPSGEVTRTALFEVAEQRFTRAIEAAQATGTDSILNTALVGRARVRLNLGRGAEAAADARRVRENFVRNVTASGASSRRENRVFAQSNPTTGFAAAVSPVYRNLMVGGVPDPRVPTVDTNRTSPTGVELIVQNKYTDLGSNLPLATWDEAQLIIAEVEGGQTAVDIINMFRQRAELPVFSSSDPAAIRAQVLEERRRELFLESHRLYDIVRLNIPLNPPPGSPYHVSGLTYGSTTCLPLPAIEKLNNPKIGG